MTELEAYQNALNPDKMKTLLSGECGVSWTMARIIMIKILEKARLDSGWSCVSCGSADHSIELKRQGFMSCCPERHLVPPPKE